MQRTRVALVFGGRSSEHSISCVTASGIMAAIDREKFDLIPVGITKAGAFILVDEHEIDYSLDSDTLPELADNGTRVLWPHSTRTHDLSLIDAGGSLRSLGKIDVVLPMLHGPFGEDGSLQGMLELVSLPYVGSGVLASALCMDKDLAKTVLQGAGISVAPWNTVTENEVRQTPEIVQTLDHGLSYPLFVKPARAGSSVGVSKVFAAKGLASALEEAFAEDSRVLIESAVFGREIEIAVMQGRAGARPRTSSVVGEIDVSGREFYDFEAKYLDADGIELVCPAQVTETEFEAISRAAVRAFEVTQCAGQARIDFFLTPDGPVLNEINTLPGFTPISMYPKLWEASGLAYRDLITELIELSLEP